MSRVYRDVVCPGSSPSWLFHRNHAQVTRVGTWPFPGPAGRLPGRRLAGPQGSGLAGAGVPSHLRLQAHAVWCRLPSCPCPLPGPCRLLTHKTRTLSLSTNLPSSLSQVPGYHVHLGHPAAGLSRAAASSVHSGKGPRAQGQQPEWLLWTENRRSSVHLKRPIKTSQSCRFPWGN